eukprot:8353827-Pyramimonas_sp.AAC.1
MASASSSSVLPLLMHPPPRARACCTVNGTRQTPPPPLKVWGSDGAAPQGVADYLKQRPLRGEGGHCRAGLSTASVPAFPS